METTEEKIKRFGAHFGEHLDKVSRLGSCGGDLYARLLITVMLDTFSKVAFPSEDQVGKRYVDFVVSFSDWQDAGRVSLLHLARAVSLDLGAHLKTARSWVEVELKKRLPVECRPGAGRHPSEVEVPISVDPELADVEDPCVWPRDTKGGPLKACGITAPADVRHAVLLYRYRNTLAHEFRTPGGGWDIRLSGSPFYQRVTTELPTSAPPQERWELVYPLGFLDQIARSSLRNLVARLLVEGRSPFAAITGGTYWIPKLN